MKSSNFKTSLLENKVTSNRKQQQPKKNLKKQSNIVSKTHEYMPLPPSLKSDFFFGMM